MAADTIVGLPRSLRECTNLGHWHDDFTNFGAIHSSKSKSMDANLVYFCKHLGAMTGEALVRLKIGSGEYKSGYLISALREMGASVMANLADVHSNMSIERRHRTLKEIWRALMNHGGAPPQLWEYAATMANEIINRSPSSKALRSVGRPKAGKKRALSPWEMVVNKGRPADYKVLWRLMEPISRSQSAPTTKTGARWA